MNKPYIFLTTAVVVSSVITLMVVRGCLANSLSKFICGKNFSERVPYIKLDGPRLGIKAVSNINESQEYSLNKGLGADKLVDGDPTTLAAPAANELDYTVDLLGTYQIKEVNIIWGGYGASDNYINKWSLESSTNNKTWYGVAEGEKGPGQDVVIQETFIAKYLRIKARSENDWIGVYELSAIGSPLD